MRLIRSMVGVFALALVLVLTYAAPATAQTLQAFNIERTIALNDILTTITPNLPASVLAALAGGALEIHETIVYNPTANTLTSTIFALPTGSPLPTPPAELANLGTALVAMVTMTVDKVYVTTTPSCRSCLQEPTPRAPLLPTALIRERCPTCPWASPAPLHRPSIQ